MNKILTLKKLKQMKPDTIFAKGEAMIRHPWFQIDQWKNKKGAYKTVNEEGLTKVKWVAIRGGIHDWAIYHSLDANFETANYLDGDDHLKINWNIIARCGAKLHQKDEIIKIVPCSKLAFEMYRH